ncbi:MAG: hypothetical protein ACI4FV_04130 [Lachnospiraceae bacterium]
MKQKIKRLFGCVIILCLTGIILHKLGDLMQRKDSVIKYADFFQQEENFDVLFFGTSHVMNGVYPMELWEDYGIVSYNFGGHDNRLATSYWVMKNALDYTTPKLVVIDVLALEQQSKTSNDFSYTHLSFDAFPLSLTKVQTMLDLLDDPCMEQEIAKGYATDEEARKLLYGLWDYSTYHSRWSELTAEDIQPTHSPEKGDESRIDVAVPDMKTKVSREDKLNEETTGVLYLQKMIEECRERGIEVLLVNLPFPALEAQQRSANRVYDIAEEYQVNYINFLDENVIDYQTDLYDPGSHLNPSGARKVTSYLGQYIMEHYEIPNQKGNPAYDTWAEDDQKYLAMKKEMLRKQTDLDCYLMLLSDDQYISLLEINDAALLEDDYYGNLLENMGISIDGLGTDTDMLMVWPKTKLVECFENSHQSGFSQQTSLGELSLFIDESGQYNHGIEGCYGVYLNGNELFTATPAEKRSAEIKIVVLDKDTMEVVDIADFSYGHTRVMEK